MDKIHELQKVRSRVQTMTQPRARQRHHPQQEHQDQQQQYRPQQSKGKDRHEMHPIRML